MSEVGGVQIEAGRMLRPTSSRYCAATKEHKLKDVQHCDFPFFLVSMDDSMMRAIDGQFWESSGM